MNTDKVTAEIPSSFAGTIKEIIVKEGETVQLESLSVRLKQKAEEAPVVKAVPAKEEPANEMPAAGSKTCCTFKQEAGAARLFSSSYETFSREQY